MQLFPTFMRSTRHRRGLITAAMAALVGATGCQQPATGDQRVRPDALIVVPGALAVRDLAENEGTVLYEVDEKYPAQTVIDTIRTRLEGAGWRVLSEDFLNPGVQTSVVRGWASHEDRTTAQPRTVYEWAAQWEDPSKRIVWYVLTYDATVRPDGEIRAEGRLKVRATLFSAEAIKTLRDVRAGGPKG